MTDVLSGYRAQLEQVQFSLQSEPNNQELLELENDIKQLIALTEQSILEEKKKELLAQVDELYDGVDVVSSADDTLSTLNQSENVSSDKSFQEKLSALVGMKCRAPYSSHVGLEHCSQREKHNAIIFQVESGEDSEEDVLVRVVFSHPTNLKMVPCKYHLDGKCSHHHKCKFSHGQVVKVSELAEYEDPDFSAVKTGSTVLAKPLHKMIWEHAVIETVEDGKAYVRFSHDHGGIKTLPLEAILPLNEIESQEPENEEEDSLLTSFTPVDMQSLCSSASSLGDWEKHTTGIASKLMSKMGYVFGSGLGVRGEGRVEPVTALIYPSGKSLDWCMEMREKRGQDHKSMSVETFLKKQSAKVLNKASGKNESAKKTDMFDFINVALATNRAGPSKSSSKTKESEKSSENFNVMCFNLSEDIRRKEKELEKLNSSHERLKVRDPASAKIVRNKMHHVQSTLRNLKDKSKRMNKTREDEKRGKTQFIF